MRGKAEVIFDAHQFGGMLHDLLHFRLRGAVILQRKGNVLPHCQADELAVRILQHSAHVARQVKNAAVGGIYAVHHQGAGALAGVGEGVQAIDAGGQRAFAAARGARDKHTLAGVNIQVDVLQGRLFLCPILEREIFKGNDGGLCSHAAPHKQSAFPPMWEGTREIYGFTPCPKSPSWRWSWCRPAPAGRRRQQR